MSSKNLLLTIGYITAIGEIRQLLEYLFYGEVQPRIVDDIIVLLMYPVLYMGIGKIFSKSNSVEVIAHEDIDE